MAKVEQRLQILDDMLTEAVGQGLLHRVADDCTLDGRVLALDGEEMVNFGSCSYLGLEMDPRLREGVVDAVGRYGTQFSSSRSYISAPAYRELESTLEELFGGPVIVSSSTSLGHLSTLPVLVHPNDAVIMDQQVHHSVMLAANQVRVQGSTVEIVRHNRMDLLEERIEALRHKHRQIWYLADGVYSMFADLAPLDALEELHARYEQLNLYIDDSHGMSWSGLHGRGHVLGHLPQRERMFVAASLNKAFAAAGGAFVFPDRESRRKVMTCGGPLMFSGPVQPPMLGAALASAAIHLSEEIVDLQAALAERVELCNRLMTERGLPLVAPTVAPIRYVGMGLPKVAASMVERLMEDGFYTNLAPFPAVPMKQAGVRIPLTVHHRHQDIERVVDALAHHMPSVLAEHDSSLEDVVRAFGLESVEPPAAPVAPVTRMAPVSVASTLRLQRAESIQELDATEWNGLLGDRGSFTARGLELLEQTFRGSPRREDNWDWRYYVVRDGEGRPVAATFFTHALWKDDMLASAEVSRRVEEHRRHNPYYLTSQTFAMGSLLSEGNHLFLDRGGDWRGAMRLLLKAVAADQEAFGAGTLVLRDLPEPDVELEGFLREQGFAKVPMLESLVLDVSEDEETWLEGLSYRARRHQLREVRAFQDVVTVEVLGAEGRQPDERELEHLYGLYRNVEERGLELNSFNLPREIFTRLIGSPDWEIVLLRVPEEQGGPGDGLPVAMGATFVGDGYDAPMIVGLDYDYVQSHRVYRQLLDQVVRRSRRRGAGRVLLGMGATYEKERFGARVLHRCAYVQAEDHYNLEVLDQIAADTSPRRAA